MIIKIITALVLLTVVLSASAQIYKCKNANGKTTYSESVCPSNMKGSILTVEPNVIDSSHIRKQISNNKVSNHNTFSETTTNKVSAELMTPYQLETRIRELNLDMSDAGAFQEKRSDAKNELAFLKRGNTKTLTYELELTRRNLKVDLNDFDSVKRRKALAALSSVYANY